MHLKHDPLMTAQATPATPPLSPLLSMSAMDIAALIRSGDVSAQAVLDAHIDRIQAVNGVLNAVVADRFNEARDEAAAADRRRAAAADPSTLPPLLGVPCTVKEFIAVQGMPQTGGIWSRRDKRAQHDAVVVQRIKAAGAVIMGVTNAPEGGISAETFNLVHGRTLNPWDLSRTCGGSSGGEGAIIAAGGSPFGLGSDVGGSVRIPAAFCGISGHKPTGRMVPNAGHWPRGEGIMDAYLCVGPMARSTNDLMPLLNVISGPDANAPMTQPWASRDPASIDLRGVRVATLTDDIAGGRIRPEVRQAIMASERALLDLGAQPITLHTKPFLRAFDIWAAALSTAQEQTYADLVSEGRGVSLLAEAARWLLRRPRITPPVLLMILAESFTHFIPSSRLRAAVQAGHALQRQLERDLGPNGVLLCPAFTQLAPLHNTTMRTPFDFGCTAVFNILEFPSTVVPVGVDPSGLPLSVQVVAGRGHDALTIAAAQALSPLHGVWQPTTPAVPAVPPALASSLPSAA
jgi:fatty acid amide hydrolase 2